MPKKEFRDDNTATSWGFVLVEARTQCKHGTGSCERCGTSDERDVIHRARTPDKRTARRQARRAKK